MARLAIFAAACLLAGCASNIPTPANISSGSDAAQTAAIQLVRQHEARDNSKISVYVSDTTGSGVSTVYGYPAQNQRNAPPSCSLSVSGSVGDIATDTKGNLYVPWHASGSQGSVSVYAPGCGKLLASLDDQYDFPIGGAVSGNTFYLTGIGGLNVICTLSRCGGVLKDSSIVEMTGLAVDPHGNVWGAYFSKQGDELIIWKQGKMPGAIVGGYVSNGDSDSILFDKHGTLIVVPNNVPSVQTYSCNMQALECTKIRTVTLQGEAGYGALNAANTDFQVTNLAHGQVDVYSYPAFKYEYSYSRGINGAEGITQVGAF